MFFLSAVCIFSASCRKNKKETPLPQIENDHPENVAVKKKIVYLVKGSNFRLNLIDSNSVFRRDIYMKDSIRYSFNKGSGASIGMSVFKQTITDTIFYWEISVNGEVKANAHSVGGAYFMVPYGY